jgi:hypothetical protein
VVASDSLRDSEIHVHKGSGRPGPQGDLEQGADDV